MSTYPYADRFEIHRNLPEVGLPREEVLSQLRTMAVEEDAFWETGKCSGTMYCGDHDHYHFMNEAFGLFAHVNVLQRDMCPSATKFEAEIISMTLGLHHGEAATAAGGDPCGLVTTGGTGSILHAILAYREHAAQTRGVTRPNVIKPETAHPAFDKACHLFGVELRRAPVDPVTTQVDVDWVRDNIDEQTVALIGSACNYGYGTVDPIGDLSDVALEHGIGLHVDGCLGRLHPPLRPGARVRHPRVRLPDPRGDLDLGRHPQVRLRLQGLVGAQLPLQGAAQRAVLLPDRLERGEVHLAGHGGLTVRRTDRRHLGRHGAARPPGLPGLRHADLRDVVRHAGRRAQPPGAEDDGPPDVPLLLHLRRVRHLPRERLHADPRLAVQRAAVPQRACTWR